MLPQSVWADPTYGAVLSDGNKTLTITSEMAGNTSTYVAALRISDAERTAAELTDADKAAITKIVLIGDFNSTDLAAIKGIEGDGKFTSVEEVDMAEAKFVRAKSGSYSGTYMWFKTTPSGTANTEQHAYMDNNLYQLQYPRAWNRYYGEAPKANVTDYASNTAMQDDKNNGEIGRYAYIPKFVYRQMTIGNTSAGWNKLGASLGNNNTVFDYVNWLGTDDNLASHALDYQGGDVIRVYEYYKVVKKNESGGDEQSNLQWSGIVYPTAEELAAAPTVHVAEWVGATYGNLEINQYTHLGDYIRFNVYYQKDDDSRTWSDPAVDNPGEGTVINADFMDTWENRNNNKRYPNGAWVRMIQEYQYYQLIADASADPSLRNWVDVTNQYTKVDNVSFHFDNINGDDANNAKSSGAHGDFAYVGSSEWVYTGTEWVTAEAWASSSKVYDYSQMSFKYWQGSITTAVTSRYANESIGNEIFQNCKKITRIDYLSGNVNGLKDRNVGEGNYASYTITIGKDVTRIDSNAFKESYALTSVVFDKDYKGLESNNDYPKELVIESEAFLQCHNLEAISIPNRVSTIGFSAFKWAGNNATEFEVTFERRYYSEASGDGTSYSAGKDFDIPLVIENSAFEACSKLKKLSLPVRLTSLGTRAFADTQNLASLTMRENTSNGLRDTRTNEVYEPLRTIPSAAFERTGLTEIKVPASVTLIEDDAFGSCTHLSKITFQDHSTIPGVSAPTLVIKGGAFSGGGEGDSPVLDIYVDIDPATRKIVCEYDAFNFTVMEGQTDITSNQFARLHFNEDYWDYYQGNWKRGLAFAQDKLNAFKDGYNVAPYAGKSTGTINTGTGKYDVGETQYAPANGWQQFFGTSTDIDIIIPSGSFIKTYSTDKAYVIPTFAQDDSNNGIKAGEPMFDIYRITAFSDGWDESKDPDNTTAAQEATRVATATEVEQTDKNYNAYIPSNTGLMMVGHTNKNYVVYMADAEFSSTVTEKKYPYNTITYDPENPTTPTNLLYPTCLDNQRYDGTFTGSTPNQTGALEGEPTIINDGGVSKIQFWSTIPYPYYNLSDLKFRLFGYSASKNKFIRSAGGKLTRDKAYLKLTPDMFHWSNEYTADDPGNTSGVTDPTAAAAAREISLSFLEDEEESGTTGIKQIDTTAQRVDSNVFYTLEGVRLNARPTQRGIYIHNGRKIVIK